eukprot:gene26365-28867_t
MLPRYTSKKGKPLNAIVKESTLSGTDEICELQRNEEAWQVDVSRQEKIHCQRETESIFLRVAKKIDPVVTVEDIQESMDCAVSQNFPLTMQWLAGAASILRGELGRALLAKLSPQGQSQGSLMNCGNEEVVMQQGELWAFNNKKPHQAFNASSQARIHLIFDLLLADPLAELLSSDLWRDMDARPNRPNTHANTDRIQLRAGKDIPGKHYHDIHETRDLSSWHTLTATRQFILDFLAEVGGELGQVRVTSLRAQQEIVPHIDIGAYCAIRDRYHLVVNAAQGTLFTAGGESTVMHENELW